MPWLKVERWYPFGIGAIATILWAHWCLLPPAADNIHDLFATEVSFAAIVVGFLATAMSIVLAAPDSAVMRQLRASNYIDDLVRYLKEPFIVGLAVAAVCLVGYFEARVSRAPVFLGTLVFLTAMLVAGLCRIALVFMRFLKATAAQSTATASLASTPTLDEFREPQNLPGSDD